MKEGISIDIGKFEVTRFIYLASRERLSTDFVRRVINSAIKETYLYMLLNIY